MQTKIIIGNWKMHPVSAKEAGKIFTGLAKNVLKVKNTQVVICPPFLYIEKLKPLSKKIFLGAQNLFPGEVGAFTGEVSSMMLDNSGVKYVILGHSERRAMGENNLHINKKLKAAIATGLYPILCVGEVSRDVNHEYFNFVKTQLEECLSGIKKNLISNIIIAYEPVWALSSTPDRRDATAADSQEMVIFIRKVLTDKFGVESASARILYGGSVNEKDALDFLEHGGIDGLLVGKASLDVKKFTEIIKIAEKLYETKNSKNSRLKK